MSYLWNVNTVFRDIQCNEEQEDTSMNCLTKELHLNTAPFLQRPGYGMQA